MSTRHGHIDSYSSPRLRLSHHHRPRHSRRHRQRRRLSSANGGWSTTCTNLVLAPACKDETIRYVFSAVKDAPARLHALTETGRRASEPIGEFDVDYSPAARVWRSTISRLASR